MEQVGLKERPKCANEDCKNGAIMFYGKLAYCGECLLKIQTQLGAHQELLIKGLLQDG